jgi:hypothetical protein
VVDWIEEVMKLAPSLQNRQGAYKSASSLFYSAESARNSDSESQVRSEAITWAQTKAQQWGIAPGTITHWLRMPLASVHRKPFFFLEVSHG